MWARAPRSCCSAEPRGQRPSAVRGKALDRSPHNQRAPLSLSSKKYEDYCVQTHHDRIHLLLLPAAALAQIPTRGNVFFGYSYGSADFSSAGRTNLNGWNGSLEGKVLPWVGFVADFSGLYGSQDISAVSAFKVNTSVNSVVLGPRVSVPVGKFTPFAEALFGASHIHDSASGFFRVRYFVCHGSGRRHRLSPDSRHWLARAGRHVADAFLQRHAE